MAETLSQLGVVGILFYLFFKEFFNWLKNKNGNGKVEDTLKGLLNQVEIANSNHLEHIYDEMKHQSAIHEKQTEVLIQIKTTLDLMTRK